MSIFCIVVVHYILSNTYVTVVPPVGINVRISLHCSSVTFVCPFLITYLLIRISTRFFDHFSDCFLSSFIPENSLVFVCPISVSNHWKSDLNFLMIFRKFSASFLQVSLTFHPDAGPVDMKVESPSTTTAASKGQSQYTRRGILSV